MKRKHQMVRNHWDDRKKLKNDFDYLKGLHDSLLTSLVSAMNSYHQIERPLRYWQMVLDPWLLTCVAVVWDRWECLRFAFEEHGQLETIEFDSSAEFKPCFDFDDYSEKINSDRWNHQLFLEIIKSNYSDRCNVIKLPFPSSSSIGIETVVPVRPRTKTFKRMIAEFVDTILGRLTSRNKVMFFQSYFPIPALVRLNMNLGQLPRLYLKEFEWPIPLGISGTVNRGNLDRKSISLDMEPRNPFEAFLIRHVIEAMPYIYLEGFSALRARAGQISMKPKLVLTAAGHWASELFKLWCAEQILGGVKFVAMEHGESFTPEFYTMSFEEDIADIKTVWAVPYHKKQVRMPANKLVSKKRFHSTKENLAVIGNEMPRYNYRAQAAPQSGQSLISYEMVCNFYLLLRDEIKAHFLIKPYPHNRGWNIRQRFVDSLGADKVFVTGKYTHFLAKARIIVNTYPGTTFSEAMASGLPTILFYPAHLWEVIPEQKPLIETLMAAKIIFTSPRAVAAHLNRVWDDPDRWWESPEVQHARKEFHRQTLNVDGDWLKKWAAFIRGMLA